MREKAGLWGAKVRSAIPPAYEPLKILE